MNHKTLLLTILLSFPIKASEYTNAQNHLIKAWIKHSAIDKQLRLWQDKVLSQDVRQIGGYIFWAGRIVSERQIILRWEF